MDNFPLVDHIVLVGILEEELLQVQEEEDILEMEGDNNLMREADHKEKEDIQGWERIHILGLEEVVRIHVVVDHNSLEVVAAKKIKSFI